MEGISISVLLGNYDLGGTSGVAKFTFGFSLVGDLSQQGVYNRDASLEPAPIAGGRPNSQTRYNLRANTSGFLHAEAHWGEANKQVKMGWLAPPLPIDVDGSGATYERGSVCQYCISARRRPIGETPGAR